MVLPFYTHVRGGDEGFGDIEIRLKRNLWGNDEGSTALALMQRLVGELAGVEPAGSASDSGAAADAGQDGAERERAEFSRRALFNAQFWLQGMTDRPGDAVSGDLRRASGRPRPLPRPRPESSASIR